MRLELTLQEATRLRACISDSLARTEDGLVEQELKSLLGKVVEAEQDSLRQLRCPVCQRSFSQECIGRTGDYCSAACKQKAYRQRRNEWRKQYGPRDIR